MIFVFWDDESTKKLIVLYLLLQLKLFLKNEASLIYARLGLS